MRNHILQLRTNAGLTQEALAKAIGVSRRTAIALEGANYNPSVELALRIAQIFETTVEKVYELDDDTEHAHACH